MRLILPALVSCFFTSCVAYQVMTVSSREIRQNQANEFVIENDSLELSYNFNGQDGPIKMRIRNKLQQPVYIDWKRSALIINDQAISYSPNTMAIEGSTTASSFRWTKDYSTTWGRVDATAQLPPDIAFIPPQTYVTKDLMGITNQALDELPDSIFSKRKIPIMGGNYHKMVREASFTAESSPLVFKSYLTIMVGDTLPKSVTYQHNFYVSELMQTANTQVVLNGDTRGDRFYVVQRAITDSISMGYGVVGGRAILKNQLNNKPVMFPSGRK